MSGAPRTAASADRDDSTLAAPLSLGWLGTGRMGSVMAGRLLDAGYGLTVWNRTRAKAEALAGAGAHVVDRVSDLARADLVFVMVSTPADLEEVVIGADGLLSGPSHPRIIVDCSSVSADTSARVRAAASQHGVEFLAAPVSGNPYVVAEGEAVMIASGPQATYDAAEPYLRSIVKTSVWAGADEQARLVKICHNLYLGLLVQSLSEVTSLAEKSGVPRAAFLDFLNGTGLGTDWVRRRTPDLLALDWTPTFTTELLRKDFDLGLAAGRSAEVSMPLTAILLQVIQSAIGHGHRDDDFLSLFEHQAFSSGMALAPEPPPPTSD
jgi:3-hydroxyisobutyrate dehydrogenase-like beta-hydroxyacid dehydrogenase